MAPKPPWDCRTARKFAITSQAEEWLTVVHRMTGISDADLTDLAIRTMNVDAVTAQYMEDLKDRARYERAGEK